MKCTVKKITKKRKTYNYIYNYIYVAVSLVFFAFSVVLFSETGSLEKITLPDSGIVDISVYAAEDNVPLPEGIVPMKSLGFANARYIKIIPGGTYQIDIASNPENANETITWKSFFPDVANVSENGLVTAYSVGETVIKAENYTGKIHSSAVVQVVDMPDKILNVPYINQIRDYPNGCESCSTVMALNYIGIDVTVDEFIESYLDMAPLPAVDKSGVYSGYSPWEYFLGDPREASGLCCYAPVIVKALNKFVEADKYEINEMYNVPLEDLCRDYIMNDIPVIFWGTMYMNEPYLANWSWRVIDGEDGETFTWTAPMHCLLLIGFDNENYYFNDPVSGKGIAYTKEDTEKAYAGMFYQAVTVSPKPVSTDK